MGFWQNAKMLFTGQQAAGGEQGEGNSPTRTSDPLAYLLEDGELENQSKRYKNLYRNSPLTQAIIDKICGIVLGKGWALSVNEDLPTFVQDALLAWWETYRQQWSDMVKEGLITGIMVEQPLVNRRNLADVQFNYLPSENVDKARIENGKVYEIDINAITDDEDITAGRWATGLKPIQKVLRPSGMRYEGRLFYTRVEGLPSDKFGQSLLKSPLRSILGYEEVTRNLVVRSRISQSLAWQVTKYNSQRKLSEKIEFDKSLNNLASGQNQILKMRGDEELNSVNPDIRQLDLPAYRIAMLEAVLAKFELPPDLFGHPDSSNRATLETAVRGFVQRYETLQGELMRHLQFRVDWAATAMGGVFVENAAEIDAPSVLVQSTKESVADKQSQEAYFFLLYQRGVIPYEVYIEISRHIASGADLDLEDIELPPADQVPEPEPDLAIAQ